MERPTGVRGPLRGSNAVSEENYRKSTSDSNLAEDKERPHYTVTRDRSDTTIGRTRPRYSDEA